jgi:hypothetical protein
MLRHIVLAAGLILMPAIASAQEFSGAWVRDGQRSEIVPSSMYWTVRGVDAGGGRGPDTQFVIEIDHSGETLQITDPSRPLRVYSLDGREHTVPADTGIMNATIRASVQGDAVVVERSQPYSGLPGSVTLDTTEYWTLAPDGNTLVLTTVRETPARRITYTEVFNRR